MSVNGSVLRNPTGFFFFAEDNGFGSGKSRLTVGDCVIEIANVRWQHCFRQRDTGRL